MRLALALSLTLPLVDLADPPAPTPGPWMKRAEAKQPIYADLKTSMGDVVLLLDSKNAPKTVENWVGLASGEKAWVDPNSGEWVKKPLYDGVTFHRTIAGFMIQGGDPTGAGTFEPGFTIPNEHNAHFTSLGEVAMANRGPDTGGSQFFITVSVPGQLNGRDPRYQYSVFGKVVAGYPVVVKISEQPTRGDRPVSPVKIEKVTLSEHPPKASHAAKPSGGKKQ